MRICDSSWRCYLCDVVFCREEDRTTNEQGREVTVLFCPRNDKTYNVPSVLPSLKRVDEIQEELAQLLFAKAD